jgi:prepilin-type N-terminal cleavage/methylation domain-containing protein
MKTHCKRKAFSLVELVIVIVIIGVIAAIAVPRISRGAAGAGGAALRADLHVLRNAIDMYAAEHDGDFPTLLNFEGQLTDFTDSAGNISPTSTKDATYKYGPYIVSVPVLKVGDGKGQTGIAADAASAGATDGWIYDETTGAISANAGDTAADDEGTLYKDY